MCGIVGIWNKNRAPVSDRAVRVMAGRLGHRGPDAVGVWCCGDVALGHTRLKILDLSDAANQPFTDGTDALVFNGEIFNHLALKDELSSRFAFRTHCDTEILFRALQVWGPEAVARLEGQFAFAFYNAADRTLLLARDHVGICPLYTVDTPDALYFSSEIKPLLGFTRKKLDRQAVTDYFAFRYNIQNGRTLFEDVQRFHPAHVRLIHLDSREVREERYWRLQFDPQVIPLPDAQSEFNRIFEREVASQSIADVDVGMFLSGGIDSGALLTGFSRVTPHINAFTLAFTEHDDDYEYVKAMETGHEFSSRLIRFPADFGEHVEAVVETLEEPFGDLIICANHVLAQEAAQRVKVVLSGEGGDEAFCGYDHQRALFQLMGLAGRQPLRSIIAWVLSFVPAGLLGRLQSYPGSFGVNERDRIRNVVSRLGSPVDAYLSLVRLFDERGLAEMFQPQFRTSLGSDADSSPIREIFSHDEEPWQAIMRAEIEQLTLIVNLLKQDRFCMAFSMEGRVPFVAKSVLELAASLPNSLIYSRTNKQLIQGYSGGVRTKKKPFSLFGTQEYVAALARLMDRYANETAIRETGVLEWSTVEQLRAGLGSGSILAVKRAMAVLIFMIWMKVFQPEV